MPISSREAAAHLRILPCRSAASREAWEKLRAYIEQQSAMDRQPARVWSTRLKQDSSRWEVVSGGQAMGVPYARYCHDFEREAVGQAVANILNSEERLRAELAGFRAAASA